LHISSSILYRLANIPFKRATGTKTGLRGDILSDTISKEPLINAGGYAGIE
jgi:hypothetical protein